MAIFSAFQWFLFSPSPLSEKRKKITLLQINLWSSSTQHHKIVKFTPRNMFETTEEEQMVKMKTLMLFIWIEEHYLTGDGSVWDCEISKGSRSNSMNKCKFYIVFHRITQFSCLFCLYIVLYDFATKSTQLIALHWNEMNWIHYYFCSWASIKARVCMRAVARYDNKGDGLKSLNSKILSIYSNLWTGSEWMSEWESVFHTTTHTPNKSTKHLFNGFNILINQSVMLLIFYTININNAYQCECVQRTHENKQTNMTLNRILCWNNVVWHGIGRTKANTHNKLLYFHAHSCWCWSAHYTPSLCLT